MEELSVSFNYLKKKLKLTNEKIAKIAKLPIATVECISSGRTQNPGLKTLRALCKVFNCSMDELIDARSRMTLSEKAVLCARRIQEDRALTVLFDIVSFLNCDNVETITELARRLKNLQEKTERRT